MTGACQTNQSLDGAVRVRKKSAGACYLKGQINLVNRWLLLEALVNQTLAFHAKQEMKQSPPFEQHLISKKQEANGGCVDDVCVCARVGEGKREESDVPRHTLRTRCDVLSTRSSFTQCAACAASTVYVVPQAHARSTLLASPW